MMLEKMTPNQRLILAVVLSFVFFLGYTTAFPPEQQQLNEQNATEQKVALKQVDKEAELGSIPPKAGDVGHDVRSDEQHAKSESNTLVMIESDHFTMEIDTLGRIASKVMKDEKFFNEDGEPSQMVPEFGAKPLFIRFADELTNNAATRTAYKSDIKSATLAEGESVTITMTQTLPDVTVEKKVTFHINFLGYS